VAVPGEVIDSGSAAGAAKAVLRSAPTIIFRPAIGASKAISQTLMGATNSLDPQNRRRVEDVSSCGVSDSVESADSASRNTRSIEVGCSLRHERGNWEWGVGVFLRSAVWALGFAARRVGRTQRLRFMVMC